MGLLEILEKLFPADLPEDVQRRAMEYARKHPEMSDAEVAERYAPSMARAKKARTKKASEQATEQAAAKRKMTQAEPTKKERKKAKDDAKAETLMKSLEKRASKEIATEREKLGLKNNKGGYIKKTQMAYGGMAGGKKHMYLAGGSVTENPGLKALKKASPEAYNKITGK